MTSGMHRGVRPDVRYRLAVPPDADLLARLDALAELLPLLSGALDIREVFPHLSRITSRVLPHDALALALLAPDRESLFVHALTTEVDFQRPDRIQVPAGGPAPVRGAVGLPPVRRHGRPTRS